MHIILKILGLLVFLGFAVGIYAWIRIAYIFVTLRSEKKPTAKWPSSLLNRDNLTNEGHLKLEQLKFHILLFIVAPTLPFILFTIASAILDK